MSSIEIVGPLKAFDQAVDAIQEAGVMHLEEVPLAEAEGKGLLHRIHLSEDQQREKEELEKLLEPMEEGVDRIPKAIRQQVRASAAFVEEYRRREREPASSLAADARVLYARVRSFARRERNLADDLRVLAAWEEIASALAPLVESRQIPADYEYLGILFDGKSRMAPELLRRELHRLTGDRFHLFQRILRGGREAVLVGFHRDTAREVRSFVARAGVGEISLPRYLRDKPFREALTTLQADLAALRRERQELREQSGRFYAENGEALLALYQVCRDRHARYEALPRFARTEYTFIGRGWVIRSHLNRLKSLLKERLGDTVLVRRIRPRNMGRPPVLLQNPGPVRSFEPLLGLLPLPQYGSIDPTILVFAFFPPMFGLMLADMGYGALVGAGAALLVLLGRRRKLVRRLAIVTAFCAFFTIFFGALFGEFLGHLGHQWGLRPLWRERFSLEQEHMAEALLGYLAIAVGVGVLQILFGLVLGAVNARRFGDRHQMLGNLARIAGILVLFFFVGRLVQVLPPVFTSLGFVALIAFLVIMIFLVVRHPLHGFMLPLEVLGTVGNILSYARIMAIGMVSVVLALLANQFAGLIGNIVLAAIVFILVHALNLALGIIDPTIQGLRLQYVEFFSKFFLSGGRRFSPFSKLGGALA